MTEFVDRMLRLKKEKNAIILAHYYTDGAIQEIADYVGDSYYLSKIAKTVSEQVILFCGVRFMGESAKALNPEKTVIIPDETADCAMAHMVTVAQIEAVKRKYDDVAVVCYINSTAEIKCHSDVCVTSANALTVVRNLPNQWIYFIPDGNLGRYIASFIPEKQFIFHDGFCPIHHKLTKQMALEEKERHPGVKLLAHPECTPEVLAEADYIGSTSGMIAYATESEENEFIIFTECGILYELKRKNPNKQFYFPKENLSCSDMKKITLKKIEEALCSLKPTIELREEIRVGSCKPLNEMLERSKRREA